MRSLLDILRDLAHTTDTDLDDKAVSFLRKKRNNVRFVVRQFPTAAGIIALVGGIVGFVAASII